MGSPPPFCGEKGNKEKQKSDHPPEMTNRCDSQDMCLSVCLFLTKAMASPMVLATQVMDQDKQCPGSQGLPSVGRPPDSAGHLAPSRSRHCVLPTGLLVVDVVVGVAHRGPGIPQFIKRPPFKPRWPGCLNLSFLSIPGKVKSTENWVASKEKGFICREGGQLVPPLLFCSLYQLVVCIQLLVFFRARWFLLD